MNSTTLIGNLADRIETRQGNGEPVASFRMATNEKWKNAQGEAQEQTYWHRVVCFGWVARAVDGLPKGSRVIVIGKAVERSYDKDGEPRYIHEVRAQVVGLVCMEPTSAKP